jgi:thiamine biosynthesis protein ThiS
MKILLNNREEIFSGDAITVAEMIDQKKFSFRMRIVKINGVLIPGDKYGSVVIQDGDNVQMLYLMSGG